MLYVVTDHSFSLLNRIPLGEYVTIYLSIFILDGHGDSFQILAVTNIAAMSILLP